MSVLHWYDDAAYSDLTLTLADEREVKVHKVVLCTQNDYFRKMCGAESQFAERDWPVIELRHDDAVALDFVLRHIYNNRKTDKCRRQDWRFMLNVHIVAHKYLEPQLSSDAARFVKKLALSLQDSDEIFAMIEALDDVGLHAQSELEDLADVLQDRHIVKLLRNPKFRATLDEETLWEHVEKLLPAGDFEPKRFPVCQTCQATRMTPENWTNSSKPEACMICRGTEIPIT